MIANPVEFDCDRWGRMVPRCTFKDSIALGNWLAEHGEALGYRRYRTG